MQNSSSIQTVGSLSSQSYLPWEKGCYFELSGGVILQLKHSEVEYKQYSLQKWE